MAKFVDSIGVFLNKDVIITTVLNDQLHGKISKIDEQSINFQMTDLERIINTKYIVSITLKQTY